MKLYADRRSFHVALITAILGQIVLGDFHNPLPFRLVHGGQFISISAVGSSELLTVLLISYQFPPHELLNFSAINVL